MQAYKACRSELLAMGRIIFKQAEIEDLPEFYSSGKKIFSTNPYVKWNPESIADIFMDESSIILTAVRDKKILGIAAGVISCKENKIIEIIWFGVLEKFSEAGLAGDLLKAFISRSKECGINFLRVKVDSGSINEFPADFVKAGFTEAEIIRIMDLEL